MKRKVKNSNQNTLDSYHNKIVCNFSNKKKELNKT